MEKRRCSQKKEERDSHRQQGQQENLHLSQAERKIDIFLSSLRMLFCNFFFASYRDKKKSSSFP